MIYTVLGLLHGFFIFEDWCKCIFKKNNKKLVGILKVTDEKNSFRSWSWIRIRTRKSEIWIHGFRSVTKCQGSTTIHQNMIKKGNINLYNGLQLLGQIWTPYRKFSNGQLMNTQRYNPDKKKRNKENLPRLCVPRGQSLSFLLLLCLCLSLDLERAAPPTGWGGRICGPSPSLSASSDREIASSSADIVTALKIKKFGQFWTQVRLSAVDWIELDLYKSLCCYLSGCIQYSNDAMLFFLT